MTTPNAAELRAAEALFDRTHFSDRYRAFAAGKISSSLHLDEVREAIALGIACTPNGSIVQQDLEQALKHLSE